MLAANDRGSRYYHLTTDGRGGFAVVLDQFWFRTDYRFWVGREDDDDGPVRAAFVSGWKLRPGTNDLGDVRFRLEPFLARSRVIYPEGVETGGIYPAPVNPKGMPRPPFSLSWQGDQFVFRGFAGPDEVLRLKTLSAKFLPMDPARPVEFVAGATDLLIRARLAASLSVTFLVDSNWPMFSMDVLVADSSEVVRKLGLVRREQHAVSTTWRELVPDGYRLRVQTEFTKQIIYRSPVIHLGGEALVDRKLIPIDLRRLSRSIEINVTGEGHKLSMDTRPWIEVLVRKTGEWRPRPVVKPSRFVLTEPVLIRACARGYRRTEARLVGKDHTIVLEPARRRRIKIRVAGKLPAGVKVVAVVRPVRSAGLDAARRELMSMRSLADASGIAHWWPAISSDYEVAVEFAVGTKVFGAAMIWQRLDLPGSGDVAEVEVPAETVAAVREWARQL